MTNQAEPETNGNENRNMWIAVGVIVVLLVGGMGVNALVHKEPVSAESAQSSDPSK
jgi:flagellar basal body-associated protein FliL